MNFQVAEGVTSVMSHLNHHAFKILHAELQRKCCSGDLASQLILKRLEKLRLQPGPPASLEELRGVVIDMAPNFSEQVLNFAAQANHSSGLWSKVALLLRS